MQRIIYASLSIVFICIFFVSVGLMSSHNTDIWGRSQNFINTATDGTQVLSSHTTTLPDAHWLIWAFAVSGAIIGLIGSAVSLVTLGNEWDS